MTQEGNTTGTEEIEVISEEVTEEAETEAPLEKPESVEETVRKAIAELKGEDKEPEAKEPKEIKETKEIKEPAKEAAAEASEESEPVDDLKPPQRWTVENKEWFNKQPAEYKKEILRQTKDFESHTTKLWQELNRKQTRYNDLEKIVEIYAPKWGLRGVTPTQAFAELAAAEDLAQKNPKEFITNFARAKGINLAELAGGTKGEAQAAPSGISNHPEFLQLRQQLEALQNRHQAQDQATQEQLVEQVRAEIDSVRNAQDQSGRYVFPKLHDPAFNQRVKPLVVNLMEAHPELGWAEATKRAYYALEGSPAINSGSPSQTGSRLPETKTQNNNRARVVSIAGRASGGNSTFGDLSDVKVPNSIADTVRLARELVSRR